MFIYIVIKALSSSLYSYLIDVKNNFHFSCNSNPRIYVQNVFLQNDVNSIMYLLFYEARSGNIHLRKLFSPVRPPPPPQLPGCISCRPVCPVSESVRPLFHLALQPSATAPPPSGGRKKNQEEGMEPAAGPGGSWLPVRARVSRR